MPEEKLKEIKCSFCPNVLKVMNLEENKEELEKAVVYGGAINWFTIGYGSDLDGKIFLLAICDDCLRKTTPLDCKHYL